MSLESSPSVCATRYFHVPLSHCVLAMSSHVIGFLLVSLIPANGPSLLPGAALTRCCCAVIPCHDEPPSLAESGRYTWSRRVVRRRAALIPRHRKPPRRVDAMSAENGLKSRMRMTTRRKLIEPSACFGGTPQFWLGLRRAASSNETMVVNSLEPGHRRKRVTFCRPDRVESAMPKKGVGAFSKAFH